MTDKQQTFEEWVERFIDTLTECGIPIGQSSEYLPGCCYEADARKYWRKGLTPEEAATKELLP